LKTLGSLAGSCGSVLWAVRITDERRFVSAEIHFVGRTVGYILLTVKEVKK
jgi:hypothetical protein